MSVTNSNLLDELCTDFNLNLFHQEEFFDFSLDFNLSQKHRPSDFLKQCQNVEQSSFSKEDLNRLDCLFLNLPYSCSKCLHRFKDVSLKYNHNCYVPRSRDNSCYTTHICRCGHLTNSHLSFWQHVFVKCFTVTYLYLVMFCMLKRISQLKCFCKEFHSSSNCLGQFITHWKKCRIAYHAFAKHCRHCFNSVRSFRKDHYNNHDKDLVRSIENSTDYCFEAPQPSFSYRYKSLSLYSLSIVANRCQIFSSVDTCRDDLSNNIFSEIFKFATVNMIGKEERATIIQPTIHLLENISVRFYPNNTWNLVAQTTSVDLQSEPMIVQVRKEDFTKDNLDELNDETSRFYNNYLKFYYMDYCSVGPDLNKESDKTSLIRQTGFKAFFGSVHKLMLRLSKSKKPRQADCQVFIEYLEEPMEIQKHEKKHLLNELIRKFKSLKHSKNSKKPQHLTTVWPLPRKSKIPQYANGDVPILMQSLQIQYLEPVMYPLDIIEPHSAP